MPDHSGLSLLPDLPTVIDPAAPVSAAQDYAGLAAEGLELVKAMACDRWTDFNAHDPGVTILEQLCYALTELAYRTELPIEDLLAGADGRIDSRRQALHVARRILPSHPVTEGDYRKLLVDRVAGVANCWLVPASAANPRHDTRGLYDLWLYVPDADPCCCDEDLHPAAFERKAHAAYSRHRNLGEDLRRVTVLKPLAAELRGVVHLGEAVTSDQALAEILFTVGRLLAPELHRRPLDDLLAEGLSPDQMFDGPLLRHGFISDDQLRPKPADLKMSDVQRAVAHCHGVEGTGELAVRLGDGPWLSAASKPVVLPVDQLPRLLTEPGSAGYGLRFYKHGVECRPDPRRVADELQRHWDEWRRPWPLARVYERKLGLPTGQSRRLGDYYSVQNQFPSVYGIGPMGLPPQSSPLRQAQARQLQGYLTIFDQLMADYLRQLEHLRDLFSAETVEHSHVWHSLEGLLPGGDSLLPASQVYAEKMDALTAAADPQGRQRETFLDFMLALYAQSVDQLVKDSCDCWEPDDHRMLRAKRDLLRHLVFCSGGRGHGFDPLARPSPRNVSGLEMNGRIALGLDVGAWRPLALVLEDWGLELDASGDEQPDPARGRPDPKPLGPGMINEGLLRAAIARDNFRVSALPGDRAVALQWREPNGTRWHLAGRHADRDAAEAAIDKLLEVLHSLNAERQQLYMVEHILLRHGRGGPRPLASVPSTRGLFPFGGVVSVIMPRSPSGEAYYRQVMTTLRRHAPSHLALRFLFLRPADLRRFEGLYGDWREALRAGRGRAKVIASAQLRAFLEDQPEQS